MSNIYIQEPPTNGKVLLKTTVSDIDIELWSKEAPLACRNFVQLCMEGYFDGCIFHRMVKGFIVQTGDPTGTGFGGESIYDGKPFKDEFHSRLRFVRRGLVAMANGGKKDDNQSQFFFTLESTPELQNKHTIFGKVTGKTLYNMLRLGEGEVDRNERPLYPHKIISTEILNNPFDDIEPRSKKQKRVEKTKQEKAREQVKASKNFSLLSFGEEAEEEEEEIQKAVNEFKNKSKSSHDLLNDEKLSSVPVLDKSELSQDNEADEHFRKKSKESEADRKQNLNKIKDKLSFQNRISKNFKNEENYDDDEDEEKLDYFKEEKLKKKNREIEKAKDEFNRLKKQMLKELKRDDPGRGKNITKQTEDSNEDKEKLETQSVLAEFAEEQRKFKENQKQMKKKGQGREEQCFDLLQRFVNLRRMKQQELLKDDNQEEQEQNKTSGPLKNSWLTHKLNCTGDDEIVLARDANIRNEEDWYDIYDPRNPINKRRRQEN